MVRRVQSAREDELHKMAILHEEKLEVEYCLSELEQQRALQDTAGHSHREEWEERLRGAQLGEESARKELQNLRTKLLQQTAHLEELERRKEELGDLRRQNQELGVRLGTLVHTEGGLQASNQRLKDAQDVLREELRAARAQAERSQHDAERVLEERQVQWLEEKHGLQAEQDLLQHKYGQAKERLHRAAGAQKKRKAQTENKEKRLHNKIHQLEARIAELELESSTAKRRPSHSEEQTNLNRRLKELQRRHSEFRHLLLGHQAQAPPSFPPRSSPRRPQPRSRRSTTCGRCPSSTAGWRSWRASSSTRWRSWGRLLRGTRPSPGSADRRPPCRLKPFDARPHRLKATPTDPPPTLDRCPLSPEAL